jgi:hypothetical protein
MDGDNAAAAAPQVKGAVLSNGGAVKKKLQQQQSTQVVGTWVSKVRPSAAPAAQLQYAAMKMLLKLTTSWTLGSLTTSVAASSCKTHCPNRNQVDGGKSHSPPKKKTQEKRKHKNKN